MKIVSAAKFAQAEKQLKPTRAYGMGAQGRFVDVRSFIICVSSITSANNGKFANLSHQTFFMLHYIIVSSAGLSKLHVRRPGLSNLTPGLACFVLNKSCGLGWSYLSDHWSHNKV